MLRGLALSRTRAAALFALLSTLLAAAGGARPVPESGSTTGDPGRGAEAGGAPLAPPSAAESAMRARVLSSVVGIRAALPAPRILFKGKRKIVAEELPSSGTGSGILVDPSGTILTCAHVVGVAGRVSVFLPGDLEVTGTVMVADRASDLALVTIAGGPYPSLEWLGMPDLSQGARVHLASRPGGYEVRFRPGELAAPGLYHLGHSPLEFFRKFLGRIEPGDSGGALVDAEGRFIGLVSVGHSESGMGYAIAREFIAAGLTRLREGSPVVWPWLGVGVETPQGEKGARIWAVSPGSAAASAGLRKGERIVAIDGRPVEHFLPAMLAVLARPVGTRFSLEVEAAPGLAAGSPARDAKEEIPPARKRRNVTVFTMLRPLEPPLPPLDVFEKLTGIRLAMKAPAGAEPGGLRVERLAWVPGGAGEKPYGIGSRLVAMVPGGGLVLALEEGRTDQEVMLKRIEDLADALGDSIVGARVAAVLVWSTEGRRETTLLSGEANAYPLL